MTFILRALHMSDLTSDMWLLCYFGHKEVWFYLTKFYILVQKQLKHCTYDVILRCVRANIVAVDKQYYTCLVWVCSLRYSTCKALLPYCHLWNLRLYNMFPLYLINGTIFEKKSYGTWSVCFDFPFNFCLKYFSSSESFSEIIS